MAADSTPISNLIIFSSLLLTLPSHTATVAITAVAVCKDTLYPSFCQKALPINNATATLHDYARFGIRKSIAAAAKFSDSIDNHLAAEKSTPVNAAEIRALQDCRYLARLNVDFLSATHRKVSAGQTSLPEAASEHAQTMLSAVLTNTQTCIDGLQTNAATWTLRNDIISPIQNNDKLYSVSLALFNKAFGRKKTRSGFFNNKPTGFLHGRFPRFKMSEIHDGGGDEVVVSDVVVVSQDGSGNFTTISDAVDFAPKNSAAGGGYFLINVTAGAFFFNGKLTHTFPGYPGSQGHPTNSPRPSPIKGITMWQAYDLDIAECSPRGSNPSSQGYHPLTPQDVTLTLG